MLLEKIDRALITDLVNVVFKDYVVPENVDGLIRSVFDIIKQDVLNYKNYDTSLECPSAGLYALLFYRIANSILKMSNINENAEQKNRFLSYVKNYSLKNFNSFIHPESVVKMGVVLNGVNIIISKNVTICENCVVYSNVILNDIYFNHDDNNYVFIDKNCVFRNNVIVCGNVKIGKNVVVENNCVVRENLPDNCEVKIVNQLQLKTDKTSKLPSQNTVVYGITKKFKNTIIIHGEGFYNPKTIIRTSTQKEILHDLFYWDKNKIILKIKYNKFTENEVKGSFLVVMSNGNKITLLNNFALEKCLLNLCE